jgi:glycosyltransferase involved in cell wall biosynthesis
MIFAKLGDAAALAEAIHLALTDETRARELGAAGRAMVESKYSWLAVGKRLVAAYTDVISKYKRGKRA